MMAILVKRRVDTRTHHQIWLRGEDKIDTRHRLSLNVSWFINNLLQSKLRSYGLNFRAFRGSCIVSIPVARLCVEITNGDNLKGISCRDSVKEQLKLIAEVFKVIFRLIWRPLQRNKVANFVSKFNFKVYKFIKIVNIDQF